MFRIVKKLRMVSERSTLSHLVDGLPDGPNTHLHRSLYQVRLSGLRLLQCRNADAEFFPTNLSDQGEDQLFP